MSKIVKEYTNVVKVECIREFDDDYHPASWFTTIVIYHKNGKMTEVRSCTDCCFMSATKLSEDSER